MDAYEIALEEAITSLKSAKDAMQGGKEKMDAYEMLCALEEALTSLKSAKDALIGLKGLIPESLDDLISNVEQEIEDAEPAAREQVDAEERAEQNEYYRSII